MKRLLIGIALLAGTGARARGDESDGREACSWQQWGQSATHDGQTCVRAQTPARELAHIVYDPFQNQEIAEGGGELFVHYQVPLTDNDGNFFMMHKAGTFTSCDPPGSGEPAPCGLDPANVAKEVWTEKRYQFRRDGTVAEKWTFASDWKPYPVPTWEPMFQPALSGPFIYVPGAGGSVWQVLKTLGLPVRRINPFRTVDPNTFVTGGVTVDRAGFLYWNVIRLDPMTGSGSGFIVKAAPWSGTTRVADYQTLIPGAPAASDMCFGAFFLEDPLPPHPWPPSADAVPPQIGCGAQRPGVNVTPAIGADGTIFTASTAHTDPFFSYIVALHPDLSLSWATSMQDLVHDGCGVHRENSPEGDVPCSATFSAIGVDPNTNRAPALVIADISSSSPTALPDGGVLYGALDPYNFQRGHLVKLDRHGGFTGAYSFGWDSTPAIYRHDGTYSIVIKDNHYLSDGPFFMTQLSKDLEVEWQFVNPESREWCANAPAIDRDGNVIVDAEDGFVYVIGQGGIERSRTFLNQALGAAYTPAAIDSRGRIYALNNGELSVRGR